MRALTTGLLVIGLLLVYSQAVGEEAKTLEEWGLPPISEWKFIEMTYQDNDGDGYAEQVFTDYSAFRKGREIYISTWASLSDSKWFQIRLIHEGGVFVFEDYDRDGLWTVGVISSSPSPLWSW